MAYYPGAIEPSIQPLVVVTVKNGSMQVWEGPKNISATFRVLSWEQNHFTVNIPAKVPAGNCAGSGSNTHDNFACWSSRLNVKIGYTWNTTVCNQMYDCNHSALPVSTTTKAIATSSVTSFQPSATGSASPILSSNVSVSTSSSSRPQSAGKSGISQGEMVAAIIGSIATFIALVTFFFMVYAHWIKNAGRRQLG